MRICLRFSVVLLACVPVALAETSETFLEETAKMVKETTTALTAVKDAEGAKAVRAKLDRLVEQMNKVKKEVPSLSKKNPDKDDKRIMKTWNDRMNPAFAALRKELIRLDANPKTHTALRDHELTVSLRKSLEMMVRVDVLGLAEQLEIYKLNNGKYPGKIEDLAKAQPGGGDPLVPADRLRDPWGQLYQIDPTGKKNNGKRCDLWSPGHPIEKKVIGNWMKPETPKKKDKAGKDSKDG